MSSSSPIELLRQKTQSTPSPTDIKKSIILSPDASQLTFTSTNATVDAKIKYRPTESISTAYSLASLYLACIHSDKYVSYRNACKEYKVDDILRVSDQKEVLNYFGCGAAAAAAAAAAAGGDAAAPTAGSDMEEGEDDDDDFAMPPARTANDGMIDKTDDNNKKRERDETTTTTTTTELEKERQKRKQSSSSSSHRDKHRDHHHHKDRKHHHQKDKHHHHHRDKHSKDKHDDAKKDKQKSSHHHHSSTPTIMTNEQILDNLTIVAGKRGDNRKVKDDDVEMMEEMANVMTQNAGDDETNNREGGGGGAASVADDETEEQRLAREKQLVLDALSAEGYTLEGREIGVEEREKTESITMIEQPVGDTASILRFPGRDFSKVLQLYLEARDQQLKNDTKSKLSKHSSSKSSKHSSSSHPSSSKSSSKSKPTSSSKKKLGHPVIIVPQGMTSPITLINAHPFFSSSQFIPRDVLRKRGTKPPPSPILLTRSLSTRLGGKTVTYEIIDNPVTKLHPREWDRIVAVVCQGAEWQFKGWQWVRPVDIFERSFGFYVGMEGAPVPRGLNEWNVRVARLNRDKRGLDSVACATFWNGLDEFMAVKKPEYLPIS